MTPGPSSGQYDREPHQRGAGRQWFFNPDDPDDVFTIWGIGDLFPRFEFDPFNGTIKAGIGIAPPTTIASGGAGSSSVLEVNMTDPNGTALVTGIGLAFFTVPAELNGWIVTAYHTSITTVSSSGLVTGSINNVTQAADVTLFPPTIDVGENTSYTAVVPSSVDPAHNTLHTGDILRFDCSAAGTGAKGFTGIVSVALP